jgi:hypothetical protein
VAVRVRKAAAVARETMRVVPLTSSDVAATSSVVTSTPGPDIYAAAAAAIAAATAKICDRPRLFRYVCSRVCAVKLLEQTLRNKACCNAVGIHASWDEI